MVKGEKLPGKGDIAQVSQDRHLEDGPETDKGDTVDPFGKGEEVPHLPEKPADNTAEAECDDCTPVAFFGFGQEGPVAQAGVYGIQDKKYGQPHEGEKIARPEQEEEKHDPTGCKKEGLGFGENEDF